jgi:hypothetical protein
MHCPTVFPSFLKKLTNAEYLMNYIKTTSDDPNNISYIWVNLEREILDKILYVVNNSDMP